MRPHNPLPLSQPTINLLHHILLRIRIPIRTSLRHDQRNLHLVDIGGALHECHKQALRQMPRDVAVERPRAGVVGVELEDHMPEGREVVRVAALRVGGVVDRHAVPFAEAVVEDVHVVAVEMHGLCVGLS